MHEMSIAMNIIEIATEEAYKANTAKFSRIILDIGSLSGVELDALEFAMESAKKATVLDGADVQINYIQARARCRQCGHEFGVDSVFNVCEKCQNYDLEIIQGKEMKIKSLILE